jgi:enoyl-[acyl-carrier protein] reductase/trans-2-enoyl-CoA reductase (NAD+)
MIVTPKTRGFICTTAHPDGCAAHVQTQIDYIKEQPIIDGAKNVLIIGCSTGYGLATRIVASVAASAATLGVMYEKPASEKRTASAGWYNTVAFENFAQQHHLYAKTINGDAFNDATKTATIDLIKADFPAGIDLVIYSLASPRRTDPDNGITYQSTLKTIGQPYHEKNIDVITGNVNEVTIESANEQEIHDTIKVMGGEDWQRWMEQLLAAEVLAENVKTLAYSYIGPEITYPIYRHGTIGKAKEHLENTARIIDHKLAALNGRAFISVNKAVVTQASSAIPVVPLYVAILYKVMKEKQCHEGCIEQIYRLFHDFLYNPDYQPTSEFIRLDDWELRTDIQTEVAQVWRQITTENVETMTDLRGYRDDFYKLFGFALPGVDYQEDIETMRELKWVQHIE